MKSAPVEIAQRFGVVIQLLLIEGDSLIEHRRGDAFCSGLWIEASEALTEGQTAGQLDEANQISALAAAVTVENIFSRVDIERRPGLFVQRTEADQLEAARGSASPVMFPADSPAAASAA